MLENNTGYCIKNNIVYRYVCKTHLLCTGLERLSELKDLGSIEGGVKCKLCHSCKRSAHLLCDDLSDVGKLNVLILCNCGSSNCLSCNGCNGSVEITEHNLTVDSASFNSRRVICRSCAGNCQSTVNETLNVSFNNTSVRTCCGCLKKICTRLCSKCFCTGRNSTGCNGSFCYNLNLCSFSCGSCGGSCNSLLCGGSILALGNECGIILSVLTYNTYVFKTRNVVALFSENCQNLSAFGSRLVKGGLVCFIGEKYLTLLNSISDFLVPRGDNAGLNTLALTRHNNWCCHYFFIPFGIKILNISITDNFSTL